MYDYTEQIKKAREYYDKLLDDHIAQISKLSGVPREQMIKINPAEFVDRNKYIKLQGYEYKKIVPWIEQNKTNETFLISPVDAIEETANQISYKSNRQIEKTIRASKCAVIPVAKELAQDFYIKNHRQTAPNFSKKAVCFGLTYEDELVSVMHYDVSNGAVRGKNVAYELVRLAIKHNYRIHGGASKLQKACEKTLAEHGIKEIYSYSNATINNGGVYEALGFSGSGIQQGQPFVIMENFKITRLINLFPYTSDSLLATQGRMVARIGGNKTWKKKIKKEAKDDQNRKSNQADGGLGKG